MQEQRKRRGRDAGAPPQLLRYRDAPAYYGVVRETLAGYADYAQSVRFRLIPRIW